jgi:hypothetical protein
MVEAEAQLCRLEALALQPISVESVPGSSEKNILEFQLGLTRLVALEVELELVVGHSDSLVEWSLLADLEEVATLSDPLWNFGSTSWNPLARLAPVEVLGVMAAVLQPWGRPVEVLGMVGAVLQP